MRDLTTHHWRDSLLEGGKMHIRLHLRTHLVDLFDGNLRFDDQRADITSSTIQQKRRRAD
ncbi:MAG TPA: hypothetical protein VNQ74_13460 [Burkholderiaceae bacterium]|nr:hypothetical protein [Burkholderiaceae bacterium]